MTPRSRAVLLALFAFVGCAKPNEVLPIDQQYQSGGTGAEPAGGSAGGGMSGTDAGGSAGSAGSESGAGGTAAGSGGNAGSAMGGAAGTTAGGGAGGAGAGGQGGSAGSAGSSGAGAGGSAGTTAGTAGTAGKGGTAGTSGAAGMAGSAGADGCPNDPMKTEPGECGCGEADTDTDDDGTPDCDDDCPMDPLRTAPTDCACGGNAACILHRYSFTGSGTSVQDSIGTAHGTASGASLSGGSITLAGGTSDDYVSLPASAIAELTSATFEMWVTWTGTATWERIFDFGDSDEGSGQGTAGVTYLFLTPRAGTGNQLRVAFTLAGTAEEVFIDAGEALAANVMTQVAVVYDVEDSTMSLYVNGALQDSASISSPLSSLNAVNNWLGRSQFQSDPEFTGSIHEFRIYGGPRTTAQLAESSDAGPDTLPTN